MERYQGTSGAAWAAAGRVRRPRGPPCEIPGGGKGLTVLYGNPGSRMKAWLESIECDAESEAEGAPRESKMARATAKNMGKELIPNFCQF